MLECVEELLSGALKEGAKNVDTDEFLKVTEIYEKLMKTKKNYYEAEYYKSITEAMEEAEYGVDYDERGRMPYGGRSRGEDGRYKPDRMGGRRRGFHEMMLPEYDKYDKYEWQRDMDRTGMGRMYYGNNGNLNNMGGNSSNSNDGYENNQNNQHMRDTREGRSGMRRRSYMEAKEMHKDNETTKKELEKYMNELSSDMTELISESTPEEKTMLRQKMMELAEKIK